MRLIVREETRQQLSRQKRVLKRQSKRQRPEGNRRTATTTTSSRYLMIPKFCLLVVLGVFPVFWKSKSLQPSSQSQAELASYFGGADAGGGGGDTAPTDATHRAATALQQQHTGQEGFVKEEEEVEEDGAILYLTSCETRKHNRISWFDTAQLFKEKSDKAKSKVEVRMLNICEGAQWQGLMTKLICMEKFLSENFVNTPQSATTTTTTTNGKKTKKKVYILFSDEDVLYNGWALPNADAILKRYHEIVDPGGQSLVISAEPNCWFGRLCSESDFKMVYPETKRTSCPAFVNSGLYMGEVQSIYEMTQITVGTAQNEQFNYLIDIIRRGGPAKANNDQTRVSVWYSMNRDKAILDTKASLFWNMYFGMVNASATGGRNSCGLDGVADCGWFVPNIYGTVNPTTLEIIMDDVPGCPSNPKPLFVHGNGGSKVNFKDLMWKQKAAIKARYK